MGKKNNLLFLLCAIVIPVFSLAQVVLSGTVIDANNHRLPKVTVRHIGSDAITATDDNGRFSITIPQLSGSLEFSYVGMETRTIPVNQVNSNFIMKMNEGNSKLEEVVVTGLATSVKRSNLGNAVSSVSAKQLTGATVQPTLDAALYGKFTGANISANSGAPGGGISIKLRG